MRAIGRSRSSPSASPMASRTPIRPSGWWMVTSRAPAGTPVWSHSPGERTSTMMISPAVTSCMAWSAAISSPGVSCAAAGPAVSPTASQTATARLLQILLPCADGTRARESLARAQKIYGGHMGAGLEEHGIWGDPNGVIERIERHLALGCTGFLIEFFGRDTREPARLFAEQVMPVLRGA